MIRIRILWHIAYITMLLVFIGLDIVSVVGWVSGSLAVQVACPILVSSLIGTFIGVKNTRRILEELR